MSDEQRYQMPVQICPRCGLSACTGILCSDCRYRKYDTYGQYDHCFNLSTDPGKLCQCTLDQLEKFYKLREADLARLAHQIKTIIRLKTGELHG